MSLIILSVAMGLNWFKNKPKFVKKQPAKARQAISLNDLQLLEEEEREEERVRKGKEGLEEEEKSRKKGEEELEEGEEELEEGERREKEEVASESLVIVASEAVTIENPLKEDPIMAEYFKITRNPFEVSPYAQLVEKLRLEAELAARPKEELRKEIKIPVVLSARFSGTIETNRGLRAIVDANLYRRGDEVAGHKITNIKPNLIIMETDETTYLLPKTGVEISINQETGEYDVIDSYEQ